MAKTPAHKSAFAGAAAAAGNAPLKQQKKTGGDVHFSKVIKVPVALREQFEDLKARGETAEDFSAFIVEALRQRLKTFGE